MVTLGRWSRNRTPVGNRNVRLIVAKVFLGAFVSLRLLEPVFAASVSLGEPGTPPSAFEFPFANQSHRAHWSVVKDGAAENGIALEVAGADKSAGPTVAAYATTSTVDLRARLQFKLLRGAHPTCGLLLRMSGPRDYTLIKLSSHDERLSMVRVTNGGPEEIAGVDANIAEDHWQILEVDVRGIEITIRLDGKWVLTAFDRNTIRKGHFGVWSENDNLVRFGGIEITPGGKVRLPELGAPESYED